MRTTIPLLLTLIFAGSASVNADGRYLNYEGLATVDSATLDTAQIRPDIVWSVYTGVMLGNVELAFRTPDRAQNEFPLTDEQKQGLRDVVRQAFVSEFTQLQHLALVDSPGRDVLRLKVRIADVTASVPPRTIGRVGRAAVFLEALAEVDLIIEIYDSQSGEILARAVESEALTGAAMGQDGDIVSKWDDVDLFAQRWAATSRTRIDGLIGGR